MDRTELIITTAKDILIAYKSSAYGDPKQFQQVVKLVTEVVDSVAAANPDMPAKK
jgi:hypothetical protein